MLEDSPDPQGLVRAPESELKLSWNGTRTPRDVACLPACLQVQAAQPVHLTSHELRGAQSRLAAPSFQALLTAWDHLAQRMPKQAGAPNAAGVILNALKLVFALSNTEGLQQGADGIAAAGPESTRTLALALQLADLAAQVSERGHSCV